MRLVHFSPGVVLRMQLNKALRDEAPSVFHAPASRELRQLSGGPKGEGKRGIEVKQEKKMKGSPTNLHPQSNCARERLLIRNPRNIWQLCIYSPIKYTIILNRKVLKSIKNLFLND